MAKYVPDVKTQRWVIVSPARTKRPDTAGESKKEGAASPVVPPSGTKGGCPFCSGNESATPPEVYRIGSGEKDGPGWQVRVVPNKYPITDTHEVFIHSTSHTDDVDKLPLDQVTRIMTCYRDRYRAHENDGQVLIFCNHGYQAGASLAHPHSQLVVMPKQINLDSLSREPLNNVIADDDYFVTYCPDFSQWPYEVWIAAREEGTKFDDIADKAIGDLSGVLQRALQKIDRVWRNSPIRPKDRQNDPFMYNYYISHGTNWFIRIVPRFIHRAGFELGTGLNVNVIDPAAAAEELQKVNL
jgi:UDPglucose--hexose-1-phosphate uridylyltransferase